MQPDQPLKFLDALVQGGQTLLLGMATVFAVLTVIMLALLLFKLFFYDIPTKKKATATSTSTPVPKASSAATTNEDEIVAVIAAAIAAAESEGSGAKFRVVSFKRK